jgi:hypothetical protein
MCIKTLSFVTPLEGNSERVKYFRKSSLYIIFLFTNPADIHVVKSLIYGLHVYL